MRPHTVAGNGGVAKHAQPQAACIIAKATRTTIYQAIRPGVRARSFPAQPRSDRRPHDDTKKVSDSGKDHFVGQLCRNAASLIGTSGTCCSC